MASIDLLDTPRRISLTAHSTTLRALIKDWERSFAADHDGKKPSKSDIKANADIAAKYKEFQRLGDVLAGKLGLEALESPRKKHKSDTVRRRLYDLTPRKNREHAVIDAHPNQIDPYDAPPSATPKRFVNAVGPTPQRDGMVLGLFDLLSNSGGSRGSKNTPGSQSKKRKIDALTEKDGNVVAQTPSRKKTAKEEDILQHLAPAHEIYESGGEKFRRTPASESRKFMLNHFFATPSTMRYANLVGEAENVSIEKTPLRKRVLGLSSAEKPKDNSINQLDTTPVFLRRTHSFKERLMSTSGAREVKTGDETTSPSAERRGPPTLRRYKSAPKPLSEIARDLRKAEEKQQQLMNDDDDDDDAMEAMREMEEEAQVQNSQPQELSDFEGQGESDLDGAKPAPEKEKVWKKKGQKRTTKRSNIKPAMVKKAKAPKFVAVEESEDEISRVEETQFHNSNVDGAASSLYGDFSDDELQALDTNELVQGEENLGDGFLSEDGAEASEHPDKPVKKRRKAQPAAEQDEPHAFKSKKSSRVPTINPNAVSHQNYQRLKIRGTGSKARGGCGGRGKFRRNR